MNQKQHKFEKNAFLLMEESKNQKFQYFIPKKIKKLQSHSIHPLHSIKIKHLHNSSHSFFQL